MFPITLRPYCWFWLFVIELICIFNNVCSNNISKFPIYDGFDICHKNITLLMICLGILYNLLLALLTLIELFGFKVIHYLLNFFKKGTRTISEPCVLEINVWDIFPRSFCYLIGSFRKGYCISSHSNMGWRLAYLTHRK